MSPFINHNTLNFFFFFLAVLGLCYCVQAFLSLQRAEVTLAVVHGVLTGVASLMPASVAAALGL